MNGKTKTVRSESGNIPGALHWEIIAARIVPAARRMKDAATNLQLSPRTCVIAHLPDIRARRRHRATVSEVPYKPDWSARRAGFHIFASQEMRAVVSGMIPA